MIDCKCKTVGLHEYIFKLNKIDQNFLVFETTLKAIQNLGANVSFETKYRNKIILLISSILPICQSFLEGGMMFLVAAVPAAKLNFPVKNTHGNKTGYGGREGGNYGNGRWEEDMERVR